MPPPCRRDHRTRRPGAAGGRAAPALLATVLAIPVAVPLSFAVLSPVAHAAPRPAPLDVAIHATWTRVPLREWAGRIAEITGMPVIVDRRLDPGVTVTLTSDGETLRGILGRVAAAANGVVEPLASTARLVPREAAGRAAAAEAARSREMGRLPSAMRRLADGRAAWAWPDAAQPRDLVAAVADAAGLTIVGLDLVPHDHLPAASLPPLSLAERLDLLLAHFDLRVAWSAAGGAIVPIPAANESRPTPAASESRPPPAESEPQPAPAAPRPTVRPPAPGRPTPARGGPNPAPAALRFTLRLAAPLDEAVAAIAGRLGLQSVIDGASLAARGIRPDEVVRVDVRDVTREELLDAIVAPLGLSWRIEEATLRVFAGTAVPAAGGRR